MRKVKKFTKERLQRLQSLQRLLKVAKGRKGWKGYKGYRDWQRFEKVKKVTQLFLKKNQVFSQNYKGKNRWQEIRFKKVTKVEKGRKHWKTVYERFNKVLRVKEF